MVIFEIAVGIIFIAVIFVAYFVIKGLASAIEKGISDIPQNLHELNKINQEYINSKELQIDNFYKQVNDKVIFSLYRDWLSILTDTDKNKKIDKEKMKKMYENLIMYCSSKTIYYAGILQQYIFHKYSTENEKDYVMILLYAHLIAEIKNDFTGHKIDPVDILKIRISDLDENNEMYLKSKKEVAKLLKEK